MGYFRVLIQSTFYLFVIIPPVLSQFTFNFTSISPSECVAPADYETCYEDAVLSTAKCLQETSNNPTAQKGCGCVDGIDKINCFASACWNRIYGCEYQRLVLGYLSICEIATFSIPYWPAPSDAPGSCSCNSGKLLEALVGMELNVIPCTEKHGLAAGEEECTCCAESVGISALYDICPNTDPTLLGLDTILNFGNKIHIPWESCGPTLQTVDCVNDLGYSAPLGTGTLYKPSNTPPPGTQTVYDIAGEMTTPASGPTFTWSAAGSEWTVVALSPVEAIVSTTAGSSSPTGVSGNGDTSTSGVSSGTATTTGSGSGTSGSSTNSSTQKRNPDNLFLIGALTMLWIFYIILN